MTGFHGLDLFGSVGYRVVEEDGRTGVEFQARPKDWGPNFLQFGLGLEDDFEGSTAFNLTTRIRRPAINSLGAEWRTDLQLGTAPLIQTEFYQPVGSRWFVAPNVFAGQRNLNAFATDATIARLRLTEAELSVDAGAEIGTFGEFRVGLFRGGEGRVKVGDPSIGSFDFDTGGASAALSFDTLDASQFPTRGLRSDLRWTLSRPGLGADSEFDTVEAGITGVWSRGKTTSRSGPSTRRRWNRTARFRTSFRSVVSCNCRASTVARSVACTRRSADSSSIAESAARPEG